MTGRTPNIFGVIGKFLDAETAAADFIKNGPSTGLGGWVRDGYRKRCDQFANLPSWARALTLASGGSLSRICQPYWDDGGFDGPTAQPPFIGGQCPINYNATWEARQFIGGGVFVWQARERIGAQMVGPLELVIGENVPGCFPPEVYSSVSVNPTGGGVPFSLFSGCVDIAPGYRNLVFSPQNPAEPDNCGDPPSELLPSPNPPPDPGPTAGPEPTDDPANPTGPPLLPIPPYDDPLGGPVPIDAPPEPSQPPGNPESQPGGSENLSPAIPVDQGAGDDPQTDFGEPPEGRIWIGCLLNFTFPEEYGNIPGSGPSNEVVPRAVGNGSLVFAGGRGNAEIVRSAWQYLVRPSPALQVVGVFVNVSPGITYSVFPLSLESCPPNQCET